MTTLSNGRPVRQVPSDVTGRDSYIVLKALAYGIACIETLPSRRQEVSDRRDMIKLLGCWSDDCSDYFLSRARAHITGNGAW